MNSWLIELKVYSHARSANAKWGTPLINYSIQWFSDAQIDSRITSVCCTPLHNSSSPPKHRYQNCCWWKVPAKNISVNKAWTNIFPRPGRKKKNELKRKKKKKHISTMLCISYIGNDSSSSSKKNIEKRGLLRNVTIYER